ncbi:MAG TPA: HugZ family protein [Crenotrichaceae bacterium]|nr:HugZ family protein [Crenotrichaceae bacterium]
MDKTGSAQNIQNSAVQFRSQFKSVIIATTSDQLDVNASYAPYILDDQSRVCIFISSLAKHTQHLISHPHASLLWIEDEHSSATIFARKRLTLQCSSETIPRTASEWNSLLDLFEDSHGETIALLKSLKDFQLFRFEASTGLFVVGFGQAYPVIGNTLEVNNESE